ncbi:hypothetical protein EU523_00380, partial [Candidatus Heimdallarchaeota archaeon]
MFQKNKNHYYFLLIVLLFFFNYLIEASLNENHNETMRLANTNYGENNTKLNSISSKPVSSPTGLLLNESIYRHKTNFTIQYVFIGYNEVMIEEENLVNRLPPIYSQVNEDWEFNFTIDYHLDYEIAYANNSYYNELKSFIQNNIISSSTSKLNNTALYQQHQDGQPRSIFNEQSGKGIDGLALADWFSVNPVLPEPTCGYSFYLLNLSYLDTADHSAEHWFEFETYDADTNELVKWFRLEWENELNPEVKFPYPGFDSPNGKTYIIDPSAHKWFNNWSSIWFGGNIPTNTTSCWYNDLDDFQKMVDVTTPEGKEQLVLYLYEWLIESFDYIFHNSIGSQQRQFESYGLVENLSVQTLVLNANDEFGDPLEEITWVTSEEQIFDPLNNSMPFYNWSIDVTFGNMGEYPVVEQSVQNNLIGSDSDFWYINGNELYFELENRRHQLFDLNAADRVITATIIIRDNMTMSYYGGYFNFTGLGGRDNVLILKSRDRYFKSDGETPKSGITDILIHEIGHTLGLRDNGLKGYFRGAMSYFNTLAHYNWFYESTLRRSAYEFYYCETMAKIREDQRRFGIRLNTEVVDNLISEISNMLNQASIASQKMDYLEAYEYAQNAYKIYQQLKVTREANEGKRMTLLGDYSEGMCETIYVKDNIAYIAYGEFLESVDVSNPSEPIVLDKIHLDYYSNDIHIENNYAYLSRLENGFGIVDISDPTNLVELYSYNNWKIGKVADLHVEGNYAYVANNYQDEWESGVKIFDISNPLQPIETNHLYQYDAVTRVTIENSNAFLAFRNKLSNGTLVSGIAILDISNPYAVEELTIIYDSQMAYCFELSVQDNYLYYSHMSGHPENFVIIDISDPSNPQEIGSYGNSEVIIGSYIDGDYAYLAYQNDGLEIVDISNPANPSKAGEYDTPCESWDVHVENGYAYVADV